MTDTTLQSSPQQVSRNKALFGNKLALGLLPFTPVEFSGPDALIAWGRLIGYSLVAYYTFNRMRPVSYIAMSCAGSSLVSSLTASWYKRMCEVKE